MNGKEALAIISATAALGGGIGAAVQLETQADARAKAITAQSCETYDNSSNGGEITKDTINCMNQDWVAGGETIDTSDFEVGDPVQLLQGYVEIERSSADNFDAVGTIVLTLIGGGVGFYAVSKTAEEEREEERKRELEEQQD